MNVYLLIEEFEQGEYTCCGDSAEPGCNIIGVYETRERAEKEMERCEENTKRLALENGCDECDYYIEERPVL